MGLMVLQNLYFFLCAFAYWYNYKNKILNTLFLLSCLRRAVLCARALPFALMVCKIGTPLTNEPGIIVEALPFS